MSSESLESKVKNGGGRAEATAGDVLREVEDAVGSAEVRQIFRASRVGTIAGSFVTEGKARRGAHVRVVREGTVIYDTTIQSLRRFNEDVVEVATGFECGIVLNNFQDLKEGDALELYETRSVERELI